MSDLSLQIIQPVHGTGIAGAAAVPLTGSLAGDPSGLFFKWFSSLNSPTDAEHHPELNTNNHSAAILNWSASLAAFGSHAIVLAATDQDGIDPVSVKAVTRSAMAGGAPPAAPAPCVVHQVVGALFHNSVVDGQTLSKANATVAVLAPGTWAIPDAKHPGSWIDNTDYQLLNGVGLRLNLAPAGAPDAAHSADIPLVPRGPKPPPLPFFRESDQTWLRWTGALPANLGTGNYVLSLIASAGSASTAITRQVVLTA